MRPEIAAWFEQRGWAPFDFQRQAWAAIAAGESGLLHARTGAGKTYALWLGAVGAALASAPGERWQARGLKVLWITPMRALASDTAQKLQQSVDEIGLSWSVGLRTGDTASAERARQDRRLPDALVTTPESLSLLLSRADSAALLAGIALVVVDEWHELLGSKRGVQVQLALARLRELGSPHKAASQRPTPLSVWALSATLGNLDEAIEVLLGEAGGRKLQGDLMRAPRVDTLLPAAVGRFPWGGHLGLAMLEPVAAEIDSAGSTLVFTNTRAQAELWYQALLQARPQWAGVLALHHGSLDRSVREWVEDGLRVGRLKAVVCTSSLDLGVDFSPVERVIQIGSAKGVARLLQRAGRSGHAPGREPRVTLVPTHALELLEAVAAADAVQADRIEARRPLQQPMDVLVQHVVTVALGGGFEPEALLREVRTTHAYRDLSREQWAWVLDFVRQGGRCLGAYPDFRRVTVDESGVHRMVDRTLARRHRLSIGTIVSDSAMQVKWVSGGALGSIEESFIRRLRRGDRFLFAGRTLELVRVHEMTAYVRRSQGAVAAVARWAGGRMPLSSELAESMLERLAQAEQGRLEGEPMRALQPLLAVQASWSCLPTPGRLLVEHWRSREGEHLFVYPFGGRLANLGLASLLAWRVSRTRPASFSIAVNDYGLELLSPEPVDWSGLREGSLLNRDALADDVLASLNASELAQRRFREIARVAGLVFTGFPGAGKSVRQIQASSGLYYEVFSRYEPDHLLLEQARREVLEQELELDRLRAVLERLATQRLQWVELKRPTPLAFPLLVERLRERLSTETLTDRVARMLADLERAADLSRSR